MDEQLDSTPAPYQVCRGCDTIMEEGFEECPDCGGQLIHHETFEDAIASLKPLNREFVLLKIDQFMELYPQGNGDMTYEELRGALSATLTDSEDEGDHCDVCPEPIWVLGSALAGTHLCFTCLTGETDTTKDYEVIR